MRHTERPRGGTISNRTSLWQVCHILQKYQSTSVWKINNQSITTHPGKHREAEHLCHGGWPGRPFRGGSEWRSARVQGAAMQTGKAWQTEEEQVRGPGGWELDRRGGEEGGQRGWERVTGSQDPGRSRLCSTWWAVRKFESSFKAENKLWLVKETVTDMVYPF